jgi:hypothetical protein
VQALEAIREHVQLSDTTPFKAGAVEAVHGFDGIYSSEPSVEEREAVLRLRRAFSKSLEDLDILLMEYRLDSHFPGLAAEL